MEESVAPGNVSVGGNGGTAVESSNRHAEREALGTDTYNSKPAAPAKPEVDWKQRYDGLNGNFQQARKQLEALQQEAAESKRSSRQLQTQMAELAWASQGLTAEQIAEAKKLLGAHQGIRAERDAIAQERAQLMEMATLLEPVVRRDLAGKIAETYGVDPEDILDAESHHEMERLAKKLAGKKRVDRVEERKVAGTDRVESGGSPSMDLKKMSAFQLLSAGVKAHRRRS